VTCKNCGERIIECLLGGQTEHPPCYYHVGNGWHRCDGKPEDAPVPVAEPALTEVTP